MLHDYLLILLVQYSRDHKGLLCQYILLPLKAEPPIRHPWVIVKESCPCPTKSFPTICSAGRPSGAPRSFFPSSKAKLPLRRLRAGTIPCTVLAFPLHDHGRRVAHVIGIVKGRVGQRLLLCFDHLAAFASPRSGNHALKQMCENYGRCQQAVFGWLCAIA